MATTAHVTQPSATWTKPVEVAPKVEYTVPKVKPTTASVPRYQPVETPPVRALEPVRHPTSGMGSAQYTPPMNTAPVMRPTTQVTTHVPPSSVRPTAEMPPVVEPKVEVPNTVATTEGATTATVSERPLSLPKYESGRNVPGKAMMSFELTNPPVLLRGSHNNAAKVPLEVAQKLEGQFFKDFDAFREAFWKEMATSSYAREFSAIDLYRMRSGCAPRAHDTQWLGERKSYELHHITPIHEGGAVYDFSNLLITTPKYHLEILPKAKHYGVK